LFGEKKLSSVAVFQNLPFRHRKAFRSANFWSGTVT